jgi:hypothetical protein
MQRAHLPTVIITIQQLFKIEREEENEKEE